MMLIKGKAKSVNFDIKAEQILNYYDTIKDLPSLLLKSGHNTIYQLYDFLETYFYYAKKESQKNLILLMIQISNQNPSIINKTMDTILNIVDINLKPLLSKSNLILDFLIENFEVLRLNHYTIEHIIDDTPFDIVEANEEYYQRLEKNKVKIAYLIDLILPLSMNRVFNAISKTELDYPECDFPDYIETANFKLCFQMDIRYNAIKYNDWLGGERNAQLDDLFRNSFMRHLESEAEFYCYEEEADSFIPYLRSENRGYDIEVQGKGGSRIIFEKDVDFNCIDSLPDTLQELQEDLDFFSTKYTNFLNSIRESNKEIRMSFEKTVGEAYLKYPEVLDDMEGTDLKDIIDELQESDKTLIEYLTSKALI